MTAKGCITRGGFDILAAEVTFLESNIFNVFRQTGPSEYSGHGEGLALLFL